MPKRLKHYLRFGRALLAAKLLRRRIPIIAILGVTNRCNLKCWYCYGEHPYRNGCREFTTAELLALVRGLYRLGTCMLQLQGGEPLLRDDLPVIISEARRFGMICDMVTNATLIRSREGVVRLLDKICISMDGPRAVNERNRGQDTYDSIIEGVRFARSCKLPVRISSVLTPSTTPEDIDWLVDFARTNKVTLNFSPFFEFVPRFRQKGDSPSHMIPDAKLAGLFNHIKQHKKNKAPIQFSYRSYDSAANWPFTYQKRAALQGELPLDFSPPRCYHGDYVVFIDSDGSVYPCCNFWGRAETNVHTDGLERSINALGRNGCAACYIPSYIDRNLFFDGNVFTLRNYFTQFVKGSL